MVVRRSGRPGVRWSRTMRRMDRPVVFLMFLSFMSAGTLWRQHITLHQSAYPQEVGNSSDSDPSSLVSMPRRSRTIGTTNKRNITINFHQPLPHQDSHTRNFTCQILNRTVTIPTIPHFLIVGAQKADGVSNLSLESH